MSCKHYKMLDMAFTEAHKSVALYKLGAVITKGKRVLTTGHNHNRTRVLGCHECHNHAEMHAASKFLHSQGIYDIPWDSLASYSSKVAYGSAVGQGLSLKV